MPLSEQTFEQHVAPVAGWFGREDFELFRHFLDTRVDGDLLELGVYKGRSAIALGHSLRRGEQLHVCDLFGADGTGVSTESYTDHPRQEFERNYAASGAVEAVIHEMLSTQACALVPPCSVRFAHIDASHTFANVRADIAAVLPLMVPGGVVVADDYRSHHAPGTAAAFWEAVSQGVLAPVALSYQKAYCVLPSDHAQALRELESFLDGRAEFTQTSDEVHGWAVLAVRLRPPVPRLVKHPLTGPLVTRPELRRARFLGAAAATTRLHPMLLAEIGGQMGLSDDQLLDL